MNQPIGSRTRPSAIRIGFASPVELHAEGVFRSGDLPRVSPPQPIVRLLDLSPVSDALVEHPALIPDTVPVPWQFQRGHRVKEARCQAPQTTVAQTGVLLEVTDTFEVGAEFVKRLVAFVVEAEVDQAVAERTSDQELQRQVVNSFGVRVFVVGAARGDPPVDQAIAHSHRRRDVEVSLGGVFRHLGLGKRDVIEKRALEGMRVKPSPRVANFDVRRCGVEKRHVHWPHWNRFFYLLRRPDPEVSRSASVVGRWKAADGTLELSPRRLTARRMNEMAGESRAASRAFSEPRSAHRSEDRLRLLDRVLQRLLDFREVLPRDADRA